MQQDINEFIGQGIILPLKLVNGSVPVSNGVELLRASIITILSWKYGTKFFLMEFGSKLEQLLEEPNDDILQGTVRSFIIEALSFWERRIEVVSSYITRDATSMNVSLTYKILSTKKEDTFTFPFYQKIIY